MINLFKKHKRSLGAYALFAFLSFVAIVPFFAANRIFGQGDLLFHLNRILGIAEGLKQGELPYRVFNVLADTGSAVNFFYPFIYILGFSVLFNAINNVVMAFYIGEMILLFVTLIVEYQVMMSFSKKNQLQSILFAVLYGFASYRSYLAFDQFVLGEAFAYAFLPIAFLGLYHVVLGDYKKWPTLAAGVALVLYAHVLSVVLMIAVFIALVLIAVLFRQVTDYGRRLFAVIKAVVLALALSAVVYIPFLYALRQTSITTTIQQPIIFLNGLGENILRSLNDQYQNIGVLGIMAVIIGIVVLFQKKYTQNAVWWGIGTALFVMGTTVFPWHALPMSIQALVQFPYRVFGMATLFLMVFLSKALVDLFGDRKSIRWVVIIITLFAMVGWFGKATELKNTRSEQPVLTVANQDKNQMTSFSANSDEIKSIINTDYNYIGMVDYAPNASWVPVNRDSILRGETLVNDHVTPVEEKAGVTRTRFTVETTQPSVVDVPIFRYGNESVKVDGKKAPASTSKRGTVAVSVGAGQHTISVGYKTPAWIGFAWVLSIATWLALAVTAAIRRFRNK